MGNALFIVWRESAEALLVVGIVYAWLERQPDARVGMRYLWGGVAAGLGLAVLLALAMLGVAQFLEGDGLEIFTVVTMLVASALIVQMVFWMRRTAPGLSGQLRGEVARAASIGDALVLGLHRGPERIALLSRP